MLPRTNHIINTRRDDDEHKNGNPPVHIRGLRLRRDGKETEHEANGEEGHGGVVDGGAEAAERPAAGQERFFAEALEADAADGGHIGKDQSGVREGDDGIEGDVGAEVKG